MVHVQAIAKAPHQMGSKEAARVRDYLVRELENLGLETELLADEEIGTVNVVGVLRGTNPSGKALMMAAHYDSVEAGPGAGDDAAGVGAILETVRALKHGAPPRNDVIALLTDGGERAPAFAGDRVCLRGLDRGAGALAAHIPDALHGARAQPAVRRLTGLGPDRPGHDPSARNDLPRSPRPTKILDRTGPTLGSSTLKRRNLAWLLLGLAAIGCEGKKEASMPVKEVLGELERELEAEPLGRIFIGGRIRLWDAMRTEYGVKESDLRRGVLGYLIGARGDREVGSEADLARG